MTPFTESLRGSPTCRGKADVVRTADDSYNAVAKVPILPAKMSTKASARLSARPKILIVGQPGEREQQMLGLLRDNFDVAEARSMIRALARLSRGEFAGVYVASEQVSDAFPVGKLLQSERIIEQLPCGVVLLDQDNEIIWSNGRFREWCQARQGASSDASVNEFYAVLGGPEIMGPDFCPLQTAVSTRTATTSTLRTNDNHYYQVHANPLEEEGSAGHLLVTVRDVTAEMLQQQKLAAIHQAGAELKDLTPEELLGMTVEQRIDLLKSNILHYTKDLLHFDVVEIRLLDESTGRLEPLLAMGIEPEAAARSLSALPEGNGVTGFVAATGKSYLCEDTTQDPLFIEGVKGAKSSLTVPLLRQDKVIGTFNVESPNPRAFNDSDLQFLELFAREIASALNTLELLVAEKASTAAESVEAIHSAVALPVDDILNDAVHVIESYIGHGPEVTERLQRILRNARDIKQLIQKVGQKMAPSQALPLGFSCPERPLLMGRKVLVVDADENVRSAAHTQLERYGCIVETSHDAAEAICMFRHRLATEPYDVVIADIRLPDVPGHELYFRLREIVDPAPVVLMTGYGYDPGHSIVKARQAGLQAVLYKPFRLDQLLDTVEQIVRAPAPAAS